MAYHHSTNGYSPEERDYDRGGGGGGGENYDGDKPTYLMEHLATFSVTKEAGIGQPVDGMRRLLQLEKTNGIWSQRMQLCLDRNLVLIMDYESKTVMERFPAECIKDPTAFTSHDPMEMYNNILVFSVTNLNPHQPPEMHIFQCQTISAQDLVEDLKQLQQGKLLTRSRKSSIPPPTSKSATQHIVSPTRGGGGGPVADYRESDSEVTNNDDNSSTTSEQYERDVTILNHCFDDIEKFIARLQHAAAATRELERRRRSRKSKKRDNGDGMLSLRTKPPHEKEFYDIFQKFKLSFNLLAKLKAHIHDPNAPELVHFLFTPLALIVEAASDTYLHKHLPQKVVAPLLTREAHNLLTHCVTSKETELWHSLGNAWITPRDEWKGPVSSYHPVFLNNWSPDYPVVDELEYNPKQQQQQQQQHYGGDMYNSEYNSHQHHQHHLPYDPPSQDYYDRNNEGIAAGSAFHHGHDGDLEPHMHSGRSDISVDSIERNNGGGPGGGPGPGVMMGDERGFKRIQENFRDQLNKKNAMVVQVTYPRTANNDKELTVVRGEYLEILDDSRKWWKARNHKGEVAHVPHTIVSRVNYHNSPDIYNNPLYGDRDHNRQDSNQDMYGHGHGPSPSEDYHVAPPPPPSAAVTSAPADLVRKERLGKKGEFRYF